VIRTFNIEDDDQAYTIERTYAYRPDLLAFDLYGTPRLWWVFAQRNPDKLEDPIYDFKPGVTIQLPKAETISRDLGV
jgi:alpha-L-fucosidase